MQLCQCKYGCKNLKNAMLVTNNRQNRFHALGRVGFFYISTLTLGERPFDRVVCGLKSTLCNF